jgi:hypothetical protein
MPPWRAIARKTTVRLVPQPRTLQRSNHAIRSEKSSRLKGNGRWSVEREGGMTLITAIVGFVPRGTLIRES